MFSIFKRRETRAQAIARKMRENPTTAAVGITLASIGAAMGIALMATPAKAVTATPPPAEPEPQPPTTSPEPEPAPAK